MEKWPHTHIDVIGELYTSVATFEITEQWCACSCQITNFYLNSYFYISTQHLFPPESPISSKSHMFQYIAAIPNNIYSGQNQLHQ